MQCARCVRLVADRLLPDCANAFVDDELPSLCSWIQSDQFSISGQTVKDAVLVRQQSGHSVQLY